MIVIRQPRPEEVAVIAALEQLCFPVEEAASQEGILDRYQTFPENFLLLEEDGIIRGYINGSTTSRKGIVDEMYKDMSLHEPDGEYMAVFGLGVHPNARGHGLAGALLRSFVAVARKRGKKGVLLTCKEHLVRYYERFGFKDQGLSQSVHGGQPWHDMFLDLAGQN